MIQRILIAIAIALGLIEFPAAPAIESNVVISNEAQEWAEFHADAFAEYSAAFESLFNSMEYKRAKNGQSMIRRPGDKSFLFVKSA